ncbi:hypothetical protein MBLNU459_g6267t1 [Dothideomycetes sp. NU459]
MAPTDAKPRPIVISGPSGSGKSTHLNRLLKEYPDRFGFSISHTTRSPRGGEQDGREYHFVSRERFAELVAEGAFIEHARFGSNSYGTSVRAVQDVADRARTCILDIEMEGVKQVKKTALGPRYLSLQPPSIEVLEQRLRGRQTDSDDAIAQRLAQAKNELEFARQPGVFDKVIINDDLEKAWAEFKAFCVDEA